MKRKGLSLIEILVSAVILALIMTGLINIFAASKRHIVRNRSRATASELSRNFLDILQMDVRQDQWGSNCLSSSSTASCPGSESLNSYTYTPSYTITDLSGTSLRKVKLNITWNEPSF
jgi:prepilin-type N-terminal cleavage/methylation domain-containing protein